MNQELKFFIENLQKKANDAGLEEDVLIPKKDAHDLKIFKYIKNNILEESSNRP